MRIEFYGLTFDTPCVTFYLWSPWRAAALEHQLFKAIQAIPTVRRDDEGDELRVHLTDPKAWRAAVQSVARVLKGWQEDAEMGSDRRTWRWLLEGDTNADGYDHVGEPVSLWGFLRLSLERGSPGEAEKGEDIDLEGFGLRIWGDKPK
jgi:hypothetical protein